MGYYFQLTARVLLYAPSHRQDSTYHSLCYTSRGALADTRNSSMGPPYEGSIRWSIAPWANALTTELHFAPSKICQMHYWNFKNILFNIRTAECFYNNNSNSDTYIDKRKGGKTKTINWHVQASVRISP